MTHDIKKHLEHTHGKINIVCFFANFNDFYLPIIYRFLCDF